MIKIQFFKRTIPTFIYPSKANVCRIYHPFLNPQGVKMDVDEYISQKKNGTKESIINNKVANKKN